ncbi:MAG: Maf family nucleotide pyrophosphatase [Planctomycetota bacterium]
MLPPMVLDSAPGGAPRLVLASTSPRRSALLTAAGIPFVLGEPGDEPEASGSPPELAIERARSKAQHALAPQGVDAPILGVDTVVDLDGEEMPKARDREHAEILLRRLGSRLHRVHTAHCLVDRRAGAMHELLATSRVSCRAIDESALRQYLDSGEWRGKAGAYGLQDDAQSFLRLVDGAFDTVVGLHVEAVLQLLLRTEGR